LTAHENLRFYGELYGVPQPAHRASDLVERIGLQELADERVGRLSRGQQQRITIARALLHDPPVLLLDEPDTGLDVAAFGMLEEVVQERTVVVTTHQMANGLALGTRLAVLAHGRVVHEQARVSPTDAKALTDLLENLARG
jgi:heme exporter protein A